MYNASTRTFEDAFQRLFNCSSQNVGCITASRKLMENNYSAKEHPLIRRNQFVLNVLPYYVTI